MRCAVPLLTLLLAITVAGFAAEEDEEGWITLFDGKSFSGWKVNENPKSFRLEDGVIVANGERSHLFYVGDKRPFRNFEFKAEVKTEPGSNAGIYFHTKYQGEGWPKYGYEAQINNTYKPDPIKTGSLYKTVDVSDPPAEDGEWFPYYIKVDGRHILIKVNGKTTVDYTEPEEKQAGNDFTRKLDEGTFALQAHDPKSTVYFRNIKVRPLP